MDVKENVKNTDTWIRGLFIVMYGVIFYVLFWVIWLWVIFQFVTKVITGKLNQQLDNFSGSLTEYALQILQYVTFQSETRPFPLSPWPGGGAATGKSDNYTGDKTRAEVDSEAETEESDK